MTEEVKHLVKLMGFPTEAGASAVKAALEDAGIRVAVTGDTIAGFRAEAPAEVRVMIAKKDLAQARQVLDDLQHDLANIDWSAVDVGQPEE